MTDPRGYAFAVISSNKRELQRLRSWLIKHPRFRNAKAVMFVSPLESSEDLKKEKPLEMQQK